MELIRSDQIQVLENSGVVSKQLVSPENSDSERVTITQVTIPPGSMNPRHFHESSEQIWVVIEGTGFLLLGNDNQIEFNAGDVARFIEGEIHGFKNTGNTNFVYISVTSPPVDFRSAYERNWSSNN